MRPDCRLRPFDNLFLHEIALLQWRRWTVTYHQDGFRSDPPARTHGVAGLHVEARRGRVSSVLVLNQNYEPLNVCNARRALVLIDGGKAEVLEHAFGDIRTPSRAIPRPSVIRLVYMIKRPRPRVRLTRREIFMRDGYTCQYCGLKSRDLTLDHVIPRHRGGPHSWENLVSACRSCNHRKGGKALEEARMPLRRPPFEPKASSAYLFAQYLDAQRSWQKFIPEWEREKVG
jgi:5-methylcytosine-specific restriction endonuclease McrA